MCKLVTNMALCYGCGKAVESTHRWDMVYCDCGDIAVDGGHNYARRAYRTGAKWKDLCIYRPCNDETCPDKDPERANAEVLL